MMSRNIFISKLKHILDSKRIKRASDYVKNYSRKLISDRSFLFDKTCVIRGVYSDINPFNDKSSLHQNRRSWSVREDGNMFLLVSMSGNSRFFYIQIHENQLNRFPVKNLHYGMKCRIQSRERLNEDSYPACLNSIENLLPKREF